MVDSYDEFIDERWGELTSDRMRGGYDGAGWLSGSIAGDAAGLTSGKLASRGQDAQPCAALL